MLDHVKIYFGKIINCAHVRIFYSAVPRWFCRAIDETPCPDFDVVEFQCVYNVQPYLRNVRLLGYDTPPSQPP